MGAPDLLQRFRRDGFALSLLPSGGLAVQPASKLTEEHRQALRLHRDEIAAALSIATLAQVAASTAGTWSELEIQTFIARVERFTRRGQIETKAEHLAEVLLVRDRDDDDRRMCLECAGLGERGRCLPARRGAIPGAGRVVEPVTTILQRCEGFTS